MTGDFVVLIRRNPHHVTGQAFAAACLFVRCPFSFWSCIIVLCKVWLLLISKNWTWASLVQNRWVQLSEAGPLFCTCQSCSFSERLGLSIP